CTIEGESKRFVAWELCDRLTHRNRSGLTGKFFDAISDDKGLRWLCLPCRSSRFI
ncbi:unnamed protein product, partial [Ceratitis capitata]